MATDTKLDYRVIMQQLDPKEAANALTRVHGQFTQSMEAGQPMIFVHHLDLGYLIVMAALWAQEGR